MSGMFVCLVQGANDLNIVPLIQIGLTFLLPAYPRCPGEKTVKRACVNYFE